MNEQENTTFIKDMYAAFGKGDVQTILNHLAPDVEWITEGPAAIPYAHNYTGIDQAAEFFKLLLTTQENQKLTIDSYVAQDDKVATSGRYSATVRATGKHFDRAIAHIFTIRDGKVKQFLNFFDTAAVEAAYLPD